jgi:hypothetical protein
MKRNDNISKIKRDTREQREKQDILSNSYILFILLVKEAMNSLSAKLLYFSLDRNLLNER